MNRSLTVAGVGDWRSRGTPASPDRHYGHGDLSKVDFMASPGIELLVMGARYDPQA
jgi:hypothetical protein